VPQALSAVAGLAIIPPQPQFVRVVVKQIGKPTFVQIQDVPLGNSPTFVLPVGTGYTVYCVSFAKVNSLNRMLQYGEPATNGTVGIAISEGATTSITVNGADIVAPSINMPLVAGPAGPPQAVPGLYSLDTYTVTPANLSGSIPVPLQANFHIAAQAGTDFTTYPHISGALPAASPTVTMPAVSLPTTVYVQGEFYIDPTFLNKNEAATSWVVNSASSGPYNLYMHGGTIGGGGSIFADTYPPQVTQFTVPAVVRSATAVNVTITATDNVKVAGYLVTESATQPTTKPLSTDPGWQATGSITYTFASPLVPGASTTLWAWAKDPSGNVSAPTATGKTVTYDNTPQVVSFTVPAAVLTTATVTPISIGANSVAAGWITGFQITQSSTTPTTGWQAWTSGAASMTGLSYTLTGLNLNAFNSITLYAWVQDASGTSKPFATNVLFDNRPIVNTFTLGAPSGASVPVTALTGTSYATNPALSFLITTTSTRPTAATAGWVVSVPQYTFAAQPAAGTSVTLYAWALDANGSVSAVGKAATAQF
jgi:hypothetical protein